MYVKAGFPDKFSGTLCAFVSVFRAIKSELALQCWPLTGLAVCQATTRIFSIQKANAPETAVARYAYADDECVL